ncbi:MAG: UbiD family decarboxylase [Deltaproteobacteria bacterium]|nr:UbiD family decarboxylase [Deltaproteobacteria bacterium]
MAFFDRRQWVEKLEAEGQLRRIQAEVDWNLELGLIANVAFSRGLPALLFENIKGYADRRGHRVLTGHLINLRQTALMLGLDKNTHPREFVGLYKDKIRNPIPPVVVDSGSVKENIVRGGDIDLTDFPVPFWHRLDGGRYVNTFCGVVTMDPDTGIHNVGLYRGMVGGPNRIPMTIAPSQHIGQHFAKYKDRGQEMPIAVVNGWDPTLEFTAASGIPRNLCEYDVMSAIRGQPAELVKCETSDLLVPASAEIVIEGFVSPDPETYEWEGPFAEFTGYYASEKRKKPVIRVECITHRSDPIFTGTLMAIGPGHPSEQATVTTVSTNTLLWEAIEKTGLPGLLDVRVLPASAATNVALRIKKTYRGQAKQMGLAVFGSSLPYYVAKNVIVVDEDIDIYDFEAIEWAFAHRFNPQFDLVTVSDLPGTVIDPSIAPEQRDLVKFGGGISHRVLIDATRTFRFGRREEWGGDFYPPVTYKLTAEEEELVKAKWPELGLE